jgi:uncharacterized Ntn-hydrolase superfamily protein
MTYSIIARCPKTGRFGVGTTTFSLACGRRNESLRPNIGVSKSQAFYLRRVDPFALNMLAQGHTPAHIAKLLEADDPDFEYRQFGIIDRECNVYAYTGPKIGQWAGQEVGPYYAAYGNGLAGPGTVRGIVAGFMSDPDAPLEERLLRGIEGGRDAGGQATKGVHRPERSAWLRVVDRLDHPQIDLRVDMHAKAVAELRRIFETRKRYERYYDQLCNDPPSAEDEEAVVARLGVAG